MGTLRGDPQAQGRRGLGPVRGRRQRPLRRRPCRGAGDGVHRRVGRPGPRVGFDDVAARISRFDEVRDCYLVSGGHDLRCTVVGPDIRAVSDFVSQKLSTIDRVRSTATHFVLATHKRDGDSFAEPEPDHRLPVTP
nr:Lrp/AsnC ligand binding domain-containing protein [Pseudonocardia sp. AL041005-10]